MDAKYLEANVADALVAGLAATVEEQPADSVAFLGDFLLKFVETAKLHAAVAADDAQAEVDAKEAASKAAADAEAAKPGLAAAAAKEKAESDLSAKLAGAAIVSPELYTEVLTHVQTLTGATGVYVAVKEAAAAGEDDDEDGPKSALRYVAATADHEDVLDKTVQQPEGATFPVWELPKKEGEDEEEEEEEEDEDGEPKAKPPPPELQPLHIKNILRTNAAFHRIPRLGAYLAVPFEYTNLTHADAIPPPEEKEEEEEKGDDGEEGEEGKEAAPAEPAVPAIPAGVPKQTQAAVCLDTMGQGRPFTAADIAAVKAWADQLKDALNRSEQNQYEINYKKHQEELAAAAAAAAEAAAKEGDEAGGDGDE